jgi:two-component system chemotaxis response regulator CheB
MARGALDVIHVPEIIDPAFSVTFRQQLALLSRVKVVRHVRGRRRRTSARLAAVRPDYPVIAIASSLGGPRALAEVLGGLPLGLGAPVVVCQHISPGFADDLARWLTQETGHRVTCAQSGDRLVKGDVFLAPSERHLVVEPSGALTLDDSAPVGGFKPSCDVLLTSVARAFGARAIGVVLTGMGRDGADGLRELRARGGHTIAQDERTSVVFGMPKEAIALGATEKVLPLGQIAAQLARWLS